MNVALVRDKSGNLVVVPQECEMSADAALISLNRRGYTLILFSTHDRVWDEYHALKFNSLYRVDEGNSRKTGVRAGFYTVLGDK